MCGARPPHTACVEEAPMCTIRRGRDGSQPNAGTSQGMRGHTKPGVHTQARQGGWVPGGASGAGVDLKEEPVRQDELELLEHGPVLLQDRLQPVVPGPHDQRRGGRRAKDVHAGGRPSAGLRVELHRLPQEAAGLQHTGRADLRAELREVRGHHVLQVAQLLHAHGVCGLVRRAAVASAMEADDGRQRGRLLVLAILGLVLKELDERPRRLGDHAGDRAHPVLHQPNPAGRGHLCVVGLHAVERESPPHEHAVV
mmetsp:Transcript_97841/g.301661  ORF Transcript_97841/g.301661 Transcript_97841/m.301661 type:complete len:254 (-) Transcript_97841:268-1029(-)